MTPRDYVVDGPDPINVGVFLEDAIAVGVGFRNFTRQNGNFADTI